MGFDIIGTGQEAMITSYSESTPEEAMAKRQ